MSPTFLFPRGFLISFLSLKEIEEVSFPNLKNYGKIVAYVLIDESDVWEVFVIALTLISQIVHAKLSLLTGFVGSITLFYNFLSQ